VGGVCDCSCFEICEGKLRGGWKEAWSTKDVSED